MGHLIGFSDKINDPSFARYQEKSRKWAIIFAVFLAGAALIGFPVYSLISGTLDFTSSFLIGFLFALFFALIAIVQLYKAKNDTTWDGTVVDKRTYQRQYTQKNDGILIRYHTVYLYKIKKDNGKMVTHKDQDNNTFYNYLNINDRVRHHKGFHVYEKYDKSNDDFIFCVACGTKNYLSSEHCSKCKCPLLLG